MSINITRKSNVDPDVFLSPQEYRVMSVEESTLSDTYLKVGRIHPESYTPQFKWFKGSRDRGLIRDLAA